MGNRFLFRLLHLCLFRFLFLLVLNDTAGAKHVQPLKMHSVTGTVLDAETGKVLKNADVQLLPAKTGTSCDADGRFTLPLSDLKNDTLFVSFIGYKSKKVPLKMPLKRRYNISLLPVVLPMPEVSVSGERFDKEHRLFAMDPTVKRISQKLLKTSPFVAAPDLYRTLQKLPGVSSNNETSPQFSVRGGNTDQNLVLIDGAPVYYPYHILGLASAFNPDMFDDVYFSLGGFSTAYGGKLGSVLVLKTREPQRDFPHRINLSMLGGDITTGGKIGRDLGWLFSGRLCYLNLLNKFDIGLPYQFYDGLFKLDFRPGSRHKVLFTVFRNSDAFAFDDKDELELTSETDLGKQSIEKVKSSQLKWANDMISLQWKALPQKNLSIMTQTSFCQYKNAYHHHYSLQLPETLEKKYFDSLEFHSGKIQDANRDFGGVINNKFSDFTVKSTLEWDARPFYLLRAGAEITNFYMDYGWNGKIQDLDKEYNLFFDRATADSFAYNRTCRSVSGFMENEIKFSDNVRLRAGVRISDWTFLEKPVLEPRINFKSTFSDRVTVSLACGRFSQGISTALEEGLAQFLELYFPVDMGSHIETADHMIAGIEHKITQNLFWSMTGYYKKFQNLIRSTGPAPDLVQTGGDAKGLEFMLSGRLFGFYGWVSYVLSSSERNDRGRTYPANFDRRHQVSVNIKKDLHTKWTFAAYWELHSGQPYDPYTLYSFLPMHGGVAPGAGRWEDKAMDIPTYYLPCEMDIPRGYIRYPWYHRLDISIAKVIYSKSFTVAPYAGIYNLYHQKNVLFYRQPVCDHDWENQMPVNYRIVREAESIRFIPSFGIRIGF